MRVPVRDYVYVSDSKVDMLFGQIPHGLARRISADLTIDLKLVSVSLREKGADRSRYAKLAVVETYVRRNLAVGSIDQPAAYVQGTLEMRWGPHGDGRSVVLFAGASARTVVCLGGSLGHILGAAPPGTRSMRSLAPMLYRTLAGHPYVGDRIGDWPPMVLAAARQLAPPTQRLEFLARCIDRADYEIGGRSRVLLGSPLYVASASMA